MIAYNNYWLNNLRIHADLETAVRERLMSKEDKIMIENIYSVEFYSPNYFIRIGLFILTIIIIIFTAGLILLITIHSDNEKSLGKLSIFFSLTAYLLLELIIKYKNHYKSGVDDALLWLSGIGFIAGLNLLMDVTLIVNTIIVLTISMYLFLRFINTIMGIIIILSLLLFVHFLCMIIGGFLPAILSFILAAIALVLYLFSKKLIKLELFKHYQNGLLLIEITSLLSIYAAVNYFFVNEQPISIISNGFNTVNQIQYGWLYWLFTIAIPLIYIFKGLQKKDRILLRVGMILVPAIIFTIRFYHSILAVELAMVLGGLLLMGLAYALIKYFNIPKFGFVYEQSNSKNLLDKLNMEALIITESFSGINQVDKPADDGKTLGGGDFGGGGASSEF